MSKTRDELGKIIAELEENSNSDDELLDLLNRLNNVIASIEKDKFPTKEKTDESKYISILGRTLGDDTDMFYLVEFLNSDKELKQTAKTIKYHKESYIFHIEDELIFNVEKRNKKGQILLVGTNKYDNPTVKIVSAEDVNYDDFSSYTSGNDRDDLKSVKYAFDMSLNMAEELKRYNKGDATRKKLKGDIIITDPCYFLKDRDTSTAPKWEDYFKYSSMYDYPDYDGSESKMYKEDYERYNQVYRKWDMENPDDNDILMDEDDESMNKIGIINYIQRGEIGGDWSCITIDINANKKIGRFCADAGMVGVYLLNEVLEYNPSFVCDDRLVTLIKDFDGEVWFDEDDNGDVSVKGKGNINFMTKLNELDEEYD